MGRKAAVTDITGQQFGRLTAIAYAGKNSYGARLWRCMCSCGNERTTTIHNLIRHTSQSCGCLQKELAREKRVIDLLGQTFGQWKVIGKDKARYRLQFWKVECSCPKRTVSSVPGNALRFGSTKSCGCLRQEIRPQNDLTGQVFGRLTVIRKVGVNKHRVSLWLCTCECGATKTVVRSNLINNTCRSCGCLQKEQARHNRFSKAGGSHRLIDLTGQRFGDLTVLERSSRLTRDGRRRWWIAQCECGNLREADNEFLMHGQSRSCTTCLALKHVENKDKAKAINESANLKRDPWAGMEKVLK